jgi:hypothetical protein
VCATWQWIVPGRISECRHWFGLRRIRPNPTQHMLCAPALRRPLPSIHSPPVCLHPHVPFLDSSPPLLSSGHATGGLLRLPLASSAAPAGAVVSAKSRSDCPEVRSAAPLAYPAPLDLQPEHDLHSDRCGAVWLLLDPVRAPGDGRRVPLRVVLGCFRARSTPSRTDCNGFDGIRTLGGLGEVERTRG